MAPTTEEAVEGETVMNTVEGGIASNNSLFIAYVSRAEAVAKLAKIAAALETQLRYRANDVTSYGGGDGEDVTRSNALGIEIISTPESVTAKEEAGLSMEWRLDGSTQVSGRTHSRGYDRITNILTDAIMSLA